MDPIAEAHVHVVVRGSCWLRTVGERRHVRLAAGDVFSTSTSSTDHWHPERTEAQLSLIGAICRAVE